MEAPGVRVAINSVLDPDEELVPVGEELVLLKIIAADADRFGRRVREHELVGTGWLSTFTVAVGFVVVVLKEVVTVTDNAIRAVVGIARGVRDLLQRGVGGRGERLTEGVLRRAAACVQAPAFTR